MKAKESITIKDGVEEITEKSIEKDGVTTCIRVKKVMNGYVITVSEYGYDKKDKYFNNDQTYISITNPLVEEEKEEQESVKETIKDALKNLKLK